MDRKIYQRLTARELKGRKVRSLRALGNSLGTVPEGTIFTILDKYGGLELASQECPQCRISLTLLRVPPTAVELLPPMGAL